MCGYAKREAQNIRIAVFNGTLWNPMFCIPLAIEPTNHCYFCSSVNYLAIYQQTLGPETKLTL